jgi:hypothetical protein
MAPIKQNYTLESHELPLISSTPSGETSGSREQRKLATTLQRWTPLALSISSTALSSTPIILWWKNINFGPDSMLFHVVSEYRNTVQVVISIIALMLNLIWAYPLCLAVNLVLRRFVHKRIISIDTLRLCTSLSNRALDTTLSPIYLIIAALFFVLCRIPAVLWTGALTPSIITIGSPGSIIVPKTGLDSYQVLPHTDTNIVSINCTAFQQTNGTFTTCPGIHSVGRIMDTMSSASTIGGQARNHSKVDKSGFAYVGRSYGVGASVGLELLSDGADDTLRYNYTESGYLTTAKCIYNSTSAWGYGDMVTSEDCCLGVPNVWGARGQRPNEDTSNNNYYSQTAFGNTTAAIVSLSAGSQGSTRSGKPPFYVSIAAGTNYAILDKVQCELLFTPATFNVAVSVKNRTVQVSPYLVRNDSFEIDDPEPSGELREWSLKALQTLTMVQTTMYVSTIGEALGNNIRTKLDHPLIDLGAGQDETALPAIQESIEAAMDDILSYLSGASLASGDATTASGTLQQQVVRVGTPRYLATLFIFNLALLLAACIMTFMTKGFCDSPVFDFSDFGAITAATRLSESDDRGERRHYEGRSLSEWDGDPTDRLLRDTKVQIDNVGVQHSSPSVTLLGK